MDKLVKYKLLGYLLIFILGGILATIFLFTIGKQKVWTYIIKLKGQLKRFFYNILSNFSITIVFIIIYAFFVFIDYADDMLSNLIGAWLSIFIIDFLIKERDIQEKEDIRILLEARIGKVREIINSTIAAYIEFESYDIRKLDYETLEKIIGRQDLNSEKVKRTEIEGDGTAKINEIHKMDYLFYIRRDIVKYMSPLLSSYGNYLQKEEIEMLLSIETLLDKNVFNMKATEIENYEGMYLVNEEKYKSMITESLYGFIETLKKYGGGQMYE